MKRKTYLLCSLIILVMTLGACGKKALTSEEVGSLFVDHFIYQQQDEAFKETFVEGELLSKQLKLMTNVFEDSFSDVFDSVVDNLTDEEKEQLSTDLMRTVRKKSSYELKTQEIDKKRVEVTYTIHGFDYSHLVEQTLETVFRELMKSPSLSSDNQKTGLLLAYEEGLEKGQTKKEATEVSLIFEKDKKKWQLADNQDDELEKLLLAFISGINDKDQYNKEMSDMLKRTIDSVS